MDNSLKLFWDDICQIQKIVQEEFPVCHDLLGGFKAPVFPSLEAIIRPALVLLSSELFSGSKYKTINMASIFQLTHLAWLVHKLVREDEDINGDETYLRQYPVLVGDYIYSRCYAKLCNVGLNNYLLPLADIICNMNEGGLIALQEPKAKDRNSIAHKQVIYKEIAVPFAGACRLGASLGTEDKEKQELLGGFGSALGMLYGFASKLNNEAKEYKIRALFALDEIDSHPARKALESIVLLVSTAGNNSEKMVV